MPSYEEPYTQWYLEDGEYQDMVETRDGHVLDMENRPIRTLNENATGRDLVEGHLRWKGTAVLSHFENYYDMDPDDAASHLETLEEKGVCYTKEWPGSYSARTGW